MTDGERVVKLFVQIVQEDHVWRVTVLNDAGMTVIDARTKAEARQIVNQILE